MRAFLRSVIYLFSIAFGLLMVAFNFWPQDSITPIAEFLPTEKGRLATGLLAVFFLTGPGLALLRWWQSIRRNREISYQTNNGKISVSLIAIEEALTRVIEGEPEVKKAHVRVFEDRVRRAIVIEAVVTMWEVPNVTDRNRFLQKVLRRRFAELMPEQTTVDVNLHLHRMTDRREEPRTPSVSVAAGPAKEQGSGITPAATKHDPTYELPAHEANPESGPREEDLFVGPAYPVGDEDEDEGTRFFRAKK